MCLKCSQTLGFAKWLTNYTPRIDDVVWQKDGSGIALVMWNVREGADPVVDLVADTLYTVYAIHSGYAPLITIQ